MDLPQKFMIVHEELLDSGEEPFVNVSVEYVDFLAQCISRENIDKIPLITDLGMAEKDNEKQKGIKQQKQDKEENKNSYDRVGYSLESDTALNIFECIEDKRDAQEKPEKEFCSKLEIMDYGFEPNSVINLFEGEQDIERHEDKEIEERAQEKKPHDKLKTTVKNYFQSEIELKTHEQDKRKRDYRCVNDYVFELNVQVVKVAEGEEYNKKDEIWEIQKIKAEICEKENLAQNKEIQELETVLIKINFRRDKKEKNFRKYNKDMEKNDENCEYKFEPGIALISTFENKKEERDENEEIQEDKAYIEGKQEIQEKSKEKTEKKHYNRPEATLINNTFRSINAEEKKDNYDYEFETNFVSINVFVNEDLEIDQGKEIQKSELVTDKKDNYNYKFDYNSTLIEVFENDGNQDEENGKNKRYERAETDKEEERNREMPRYEQIRVQNLEEEEPYEEYERLSEFNLYETLGHQREKQEIMKL